MYVIDDKHKIRIVQEKHRLRHQSTPYILA